MRTVRFKQLTQITSIVAGVIGLTIDAGYASETSQLTETDEFAAAVSLSTAAIVAPPEFQAEQMAEATFATIVLPVTTTPISSSSEQLDLLLAPVSLPDTQSYVFQTTPLVKPLVDVQRSNAASIVTNSGILSDSVNVSNSAEVLPEFEPLRLSSEALEPLSSSSADLGEVQSVDHQPVAQAELPAESQPSEPVPEAEETSPRWRFTLTPYGFVPLSVEGSATVRDFTADIDLGLDDVLDPLNFAAAGRVEAWRGNLGLIFDGAYFNLGQENSRSLSIPNCLCDIFPSEITADIKVQYGQFDLAVGYRIAENVNQANNEFELGPLAFDAILGIRIYTLRQEIDLSTNLGTSRNFEGSGTLVQPLVSGRLRWNLSPKLAGWVRGDLAGLGIGGTLMAASFTGGLDWMFSGDTSLLLAYRLSSLRYDTEAGGENLELNLLFQGPYLGVVFRF
nr:MAG: hypothetical protein EDM05_17705 [Leptolyngbya sp. IPPAS B-1204]